MTATDTLQQLKDTLSSTVDRNQERLIEFGDDIFAHAEIGFREERTASKVAEELRSLGLEVEEGIGITGVKARLKGGQPGPTIAVMGELDGLPVSDHPNADPRTGVAHACGHNAQLTHLVGVARALVESNVVGQLHGDVVFMAVPAEEYVDLEWRDGLVKSGKLEFMGGKSELLRIGAFDDVDMAMLVHASNLENDLKFTAAPGTNGFVAKRVRYIGRAAHAARPHMGVNALNAATLALEAIHMQRETFRDEDHIRVHPILTRGGTTINVVPADVRLETFVRGKSLEALADAEKKVDRALKAGAMAVGATVEIETLPGYMPMSVDDTMTQLFGRNAVELVGESGWHRNTEPNAASTDVGDLSLVMPVLHPSHGGFTGSNHANNFVPVDRTAAYILPAKAMAWTLMDLLTDGASAARRVLADNKPTQTQNQNKQRERDLTRTERFEY